MKELFNKLSNLFSFGKEHRLVNEGEETPKPVEKVQEAQEAETAPPKTPEEGVKEAEAVGEKNTETARNQLVELEEVNPVEADAAYQTKVEKLEEAGHLDALKALDGSQQPAVAEAGGETVMEPVDVMKEGTKADQASASLMNKPGMRGFFDAMNSEKMADVFGAGPNKESIAAAMTGKPQPEEGKAMEFTEEEVAQMMEEAEAEEGKPDETLAAAAHEAGVKAEEEGPFEPLDLSEEGEEAQVAGTSTREPKQ